FALKGFQTLHVVAGPERGGHQRLGLASGEDGAAMGSGKNAGFDPDFADFVEGAGVRAPLLFDDLVAEDSFAQGLVIFLQLLLGVFGFVVVGNRRFQFFLDVLDQGVAFGLGMLLGVQSIGQ